ncbi:hypothetical protein ACTGW0_07555 [Streptococcus suis]
MTRYNTIHEINDTWGSYEEKGKTAQWVNLKTGERYDIKNILRLVVRKSPTGESSHYFFFMLK